MSSPWVQEAGPDAETTAASESLLSQSEELASETRRSRQDHHNNAKCYQAN